MLFDSNILIYAARPELGHVREFLLANPGKTSAISKLEVLGFPKLTELERRDLTEIFALLEVCPISDEIIDKAVDLRQKRAVSLGDAIVAATALTLNVPLVTRNVSDFDWIDGLQTINPVDS